MVGRGGEGRRVGRVDGRTKEGQKGGASRATQAGAQADQEVLCRQMSSTKSRHNGNRKSRSSSACSSIHIIVITLSFHYASHSCARLSPSPTISSTSPPLSLVRLLHPLLCGLPVDDLPDILQVSSLVVLVLQVVAVLPHVDAYEGNVR